MERNNNHNHNNGSGNGFLLGVIVGVLLTLLFTTKRGRAILKEVMEKGFEKFVNLETLMKETEEEFEDEDEEGDDYVHTEPVQEIEPPKVEKVEKKIEVTQLAPSNEETPAPPPAPKIVKEAPKFLEEEGEDETTEDELVPEPDEEKPKTTRVKRLFRGLRKKN